MVSDGLRNVASPISTASVHRILAIERAIRGRNKAAE
jgi:hypothetical protein